MIFEEISQEELARWKAQPFTKLFFNFMNDRLTEERNAITNLLTAGQIPPQERIATLAFHQKIINDLCEITHHDINSLYIATYQANYTINNKE